MSIPPKSIDPFLLSEDEVVNKVAKYLRKNKYRIEKLSKGRSHGVDIIAFNEAKSEHLYIEAKGNIKNNYNEKKQFSGLQIAHHFDVQLSQICQVIHRYGNVTNNRFAMANPCVPRILNRVEVTKTALKLLPIFLIWVEPNNKVWEESI